MDELLVKYLLEEATSEEKQQVETWAAQSESNKKQLDHTALLLNESRKAAAVSTQDEGEAWQRFQQLVREKESATRVVSLKRRRALWMAAAALALAVGIWFASTLGRSEKEIPVLVQTKQAVLTDTLPDGSIITLNKNSEIEYSSRLLKNNSRSIKLTGEAFFNVTPNKEKPFIVAINNATIKVVGTSFNIKNINGSTEVIVKSGIVDVTHNGKTISLMPGEKTLLLATDTTVSKTMVTDELYRHYEAKEFVCNNTPLWRLVEVLNEAYGSNIIIENKTVRSLPLTATFSNESLEKILKVVAVTFQINVVEKNGQIILQ
jgi:transmembrane sensor